MFKLGFHPKFEPYPATRDLRFTVNPCNTPTPQATVIWTAPAGFDITQWHHYAATYTATPTPTPTMAIYVDGVQVATSAGPATLTQDTGPIYIGADETYQDTLPPNGRHFLGVLDDMRMYNRALSWWEIMEMSELFNAPPYY